MPSKVITSDFESFVLYSFQCSRICNPLPTIFYYLLAGELQSPAYSKRLFYIVFHTKLIQILYDDRP